jgi:hypothetical protein
MQTIDLRQDADRLHAQLNSQLNSQTQSQTPQYSPEASTPTRQTSRQTPRYSPESPLSPSSASSQNTQQIPSTEEKRTPGRPPKTTQEGTEKKRFQWSSLVSSQKVNLNSEFRPFVLRFLGSFFVFTTFKTLSVLIPQFPLLVLFSAAFALGLYLNRPSWVTSSSAVFIAYLFFRIL